ncbi:MAG TPA: hypothetical protein VFH61_00235 [Thermoleophilia bacterium]|nr:hypothetical protein [Thermoleophilia bacterium]
MILIFENEAAAEVVRDADGTAHVKHGNRMDTASSRGGLFGRIGRKSSDEAELRAAFAGEKDEG